MHIFGVKNFTHDCRMTHKVDNIDSHFSYNQELMTETSIINDIFVLTHNTV